MSNTSSPPPLQAPKRVLVLRYSQTGQLTAIADRILGPLMEDPQIVVHVETLVPRQAYPFPWPFFRFLDAFPESALMVAPPLQPLGLKGDEEFDLVILPYQVWFLAPSLPITGFLKHPVAAQLLRGKPVVTVIACRNMWLVAQEKMKTLLHALGARLIDNVVLTDPSPSLATFITTPRWVLTGRKQSFWGLPAAGISETQIQQARRFGLALRDALHEGRERGDAPLLAGLAAAQVQPNLYFSEMAGRRGFFIWGSLLRAVGRPGSWQRVPVLAIYATFLATMIVSLVPTSMALQALARPLLKSWLGQVKQRFELPSGSGTERLASYDH